MSWQLINQTHSWADFVKALGPLRSEERGGAFELLTELFLQIDPVYQSKLKKDLA